MKYSFVLRGAAIAMVGTLPLLADFTYEETSQITGGAMLRVVKMAGVFSKKGRQLTEPIPATISIKGNRMIRKSADQATIIDLDQQTITLVNFEKKTYSVETFDQLKKQMAEVAARERSRNTQSEQQPEVSFDVKVNDTGQSKVINGNNAHEMVMTMTMTGSSTDPKNPGQGSLNMVNHLWIAPNVSGYSEVRDFHRRMAESLGWVPGENPMLSRPDMAKAMGQLYKEASKLDGMPLLTTTSMTGTAQGPRNSSSEAAPSDQSSAQHTEQHTAMPPTSVGDALSGALGNRFGFGRHKKPQQQPVSDTSTSNSASAAATPNADSQQSEASLLELTSQVTSYNSGPVDTAVFDVPAGFEKVEADANARARR